LPKLWERQSWDTDTSYERFLTFYLPQDVPRSLDAAYRAFKGLHKGDKGVTKFPRAPRVWRNWYAGKDNTAKPISRAVGWDIRAKAWDAERHAKQLEDIEEERRARQEDLRILANAGLNKVAAVLNRFDPKRYDVEDIRLTELTQAMKTVAAEVRRAYDLEEALSIRHEIIDWRSEAVKVIREGSVSWHDVSGEFGDELAHELFDAAGVSADAGRKLAEKSGDGRNTNSV
jgi:hypothetical protein